MAQTLGTLLIDVKSDTTQLIQGFNRAESAVNKTTKTMSNAVKGFIAAYAGISAIDAGKEFVRLSDAAKNIDSRLKLVTKSTQELSKAQSELFKISQNASIEFESTVDLYSRMARSTRDLNVSQEDLLKVTDTISKALVVSGGEAASMNAALTQLSQGFASGTLRGEELNSVIEQTPRLAEAIATGMGISLGALRDVASQGKLTSEVLIKAILSQSQVLNEESSQIAQTAEKTQVKILNSLIRLASNIDKLIGFGNSVNDVLTTITESMDNASTYLENDGHTIIATLGKIKDNFVLLGADIKNVAELLLDSVGIMAFGALEPVTKVLYEATKALNSVGLSSDETLQSSLEFYNFAQKGLTNFKESAVNNLQDIDNAYKQSKLTINERIALLKQENQSTLENNKITEETSHKKQKLVNTEVKQVATKKDLITQLEIQKEKEKEFLSADDWKSYYETIGEYSNGWLIEQGNIYAKYADLTTGEMNKLLEISKKQYFDKFKEEQEKIKPFEFDIDLDSFDTPINNAIRAMDKLNESTEKYNNYIKQSGLTKEDIAKADEKNLSNQLKGYSNIAGAISGLFKEGSRDAATFQVAQTALALVEGTRAVLTAGTGDPYTAIPRMIAMGAMVSSLLGNIGVAFGMNKSSTSSDSFSSMVANTGTGSTLGDSKKASESITNALNVLEDFAEPQFQTLVSMNAYLKTIASSIGGVTSLLIQSGGFAFGEGYTGFDTGFKNNISGTIGTLLNPASLFDGILSKIPVIGQINGLFGNIVNSVLGGLFGKTSVSQSMTDSGIFFANQLLTNAIEDFNGSAYQTIATTVSKKSWFSKSSSTTINSYFQALNNETERQFSLVLGNLYNTVLTAGSALDSTSEQTAKSLENFAVSIGKISLMGKTGDQIQETLTNIFGRIGDDIAKTAFPLLTPFQQIGEGMFETLTRVATGMEEADYYISRLGNRFNDVVYTMIGNKQGDVGFEALLQSIERVENATYPTNNGLLDIVENLDLTAEELYNVYTNLDELRDRLIFLGQESQGLSNSMIYGAGSVSELDNGFKAFFDNFLTENEQLTYQTQQLIEEFNNLGISLPISKDGFKQLLSGIDLTTESGQELYGRLIILSEGFAEVADKTAESITKLQNELDTLNNTAIENFKTNIQSIINTVDGLRDIAKSFLDSFANKEGNVRNQIIQYNKLRKEFESFFESGVLKAGVNDSQIKDLYSELSTIGKSLGQSQESLVNDLTTQFENDLSRLDLSNEILKVAIVDGIGELANETTLSSLNEFTKQQLEILKKTQAQELQSLSSSTFLFGSNIGTQEKIDISKLLGVSYDTAKPLVESLQGISSLSGADLTSSLKSIVGFTGTGFNLNTFEQISKLSSYLNPNIMDSLGQISSEASTNLQIQQLQEQKKADFLATLENAKMYYEQQKAESDQAKGYYDSQWHSISAGDNGARQQENIENGTPYQIQSPPYINEKNLGAWQKHISNVYTPYINEFSQSVSAYQAYQDLLKQKEVLGYAVGAVNIPQDQIAQIHRGEMIIPSTFSEGLRNGDLTLSGRMPNLDNFSILNGISEMIGNLVYNIGEYPKKTYDILDDVINGRNSMRVQQI